METITRLMTELTATTGPDAYLNAGYAVIHADGRLQSFVTGHITPAGMPFKDATTRLRMASIAKAATGRALCALAVRGEVSLDADIVDLLKWRDAPEALRKRPVTLRHLLSHTSGLTDHAGYLVDPGKSLLRFISEHPKAISGYAPGSYFAYANLNYILLGHVLEAATAKRFDHILRDEVLTPAGIAGGFNWAGVPLSDRTNHLPLYQRMADGLTVQADAADADWQADLIWRGGGGRAFANYRLAEDTGLLSPHAGLRMNIIEAARLARLLSDASAAGQLQRQIAWRFDPRARNGEDCDGLFMAFGLGLTIYENHSRIPGHLVGHAGHALGFSGGVWHNVTTRMSHAYFMTGGPDETEGLDTESFYSAAELRIMQKL
jgi:CubicO group peptidase (beta-lactamase class C family)